MINFALGIMVGMILHLLLECIAEDRSIRKSEKLDNSDLL